MKEEASQFQLPRELSKGMAMVVQHFAEYAQQPPYRKERIVMDDTRIQPQSKNVVIQMIQA